MSETAPELPPLRDVIAATASRRAASLGQNFLLDLNLTGRIARAAGTAGARHMSSRSAPGRAA